MQKYLEKLYSNSPAFFQNLMVTGYGLKIYRREYGPKFRKALAEFEKRQWLPLDQIKEYQNERLRILIKHAYDNVPYYNKVMRDRHLTPDDIRTSEDLRKLPIITRADLKKDPKQFIATNFKPGQMIVGHTSGTTGSPIELYWDDQICQIKTVVDWRQKLTAGISVGDRIAFFLARPVVPVGRTRPPFWRHNYILNHMFCSSWHMSKENLPIYLDKLKKFAPKAIEGYPSTISILAKYILSQNTTFPMKVVFTSSETLLPSQKEAIEKAFACRLFDFYGMAERVAFATECDVHEGKHFNMDFSITEVLSADGVPAEYGQLGRIVATGLHNFAMPLIRYQTSDITAIRKAPCTCGRGFILMENIASKDEDIVITRGGRLISASLLNGVTHHMTSIAEHQFVQDDLEHARLRIVKKPEFSEADHQFIVKGFNAIFGDEMKVVIEYVDNIPKTSAGKFRWVISKVPLPF
jgi:phenylacetate-CoA ligase